MLHISLAAEELFKLGSFGVTNTLLISTFIVVALSLFAIVISRRLKAVPSGSQNFVEFVIEGVLDFMDTITGKRESSVKFLPLVFTIFLFVFFSNLIEIIPGLGTIGLVEIKDGHEVFLPFLRSSSADLNATLAVAVSAVIGIQVLGIGALGFFRHWKKFFCPPWEKPYLIGTFVGILELVAEVAKVISFSFRLFGNIFAGEVLLTVILFLAPLFIPLPFMALEVFVGLIQATVFSMLTLVFLKVATEHH